MEGKQRGMRRGVFLVNDAYGGNEEGCEAQTHGIDRHDASESGAGGKDDIDPEETSAANAAEDAQSRGKAETEAAKGAVSVVEWSRNVDEQKVKARLRESVGSYFRLAREGEMIMPVA